MAHRTADEAAVRAVLARIKAAWKGKQFEALSDCFAENAVITGPGYEVFAEGREPCAESYREFARNSQVLEFSERKLVVRMWPATAVCSFSWRMTWQRAGDVHTQSGTDQLVLTPFEGRWRVVFRHVQFAADP